MLTGKDKRALKARGQVMGDDCRIGKAGVDAKFIAHLDGILRLRELVKVRFGDVEGSARKELAAEVCGAVGAQCIGILGRTMLLYRKKVEEDTAPLTTPPPDR